MCIQMAALSSAHRVTDVGVIVDALLSQVPVEQLRRSLVPAAQATLHFTAKLAIGQRTAVATCLMRLWEARRQGRANERLTSAAGSG